MKEEPCAGSMEDLVNEIMEEHEEYEKQSETQGDNNADEKMEVDTPTSDIKREPLDSPPPLMLGPRVLLSPVEIKKEPVFSTPKTQPSEKKSKSSTVSKTVNSKDSRSSPKVELPTSPPSLFGGSKVSAYSILLHEGLVGMVGS